MSRPSDPKVIEQQENARIYCRICNAVQIFCAIWPIAIVLIWPAILENIAIGAPLLILSIVQFLFVPDAVAGFLTR